MKKIFALLLTALLAVSLFVTAGAAGDKTVVYLKDGGTGDGSTADAAVGTMTDAYAALDLSKDCTIVICGTYTQTDRFDYGVDYDGSVTITSVYGGMDYRSSGAAYTFSASRFTCYGATTFENLDFVCTGTNLLVVGQCNPLKIGEGVTMTGDGMPGGSVAKSFCLLGGYQDGQGVPPAESDEDTSITVLSGSKIYVIPFSRNILAKYTGTANITIGGSADVAVLHGSAAYPDGITVGDVNVTITGNAHIKNFYGCTQDTTANSYTFNWESGTIDAFYWVCPNTSSKMITINNPTVLKVSDAVKATDNYATIAANFDTIGALDAGVALKMTLGKTVYTLNGEQKTMDVAPIIRNERTMLPVRYVAEALGATIGWDGATSTATLTTADTEIKITVGAAEAMVNGQAVKLDSPAFIENDRTYMPVRFVAETLGGTVAWDGATSTATITK